MLDNIINDIKQYCELNKFDYDEVYFDILVKGFNIVKYGYKPVVLKKETPKDDLSAQKEKKTEINEDKSHLSEFKTQENLYD